MQFEITLDEEGRDFYCRTDESVLAGMRRQGLSEISVGCRSGGCGVCKVRISQGEYECKKMSRAHVTADEEEKGYVLACRCQPLSDLTIEVIGKMKYIKKDQSYKTKFGGE